MQNPTPQPHDEYAEHTPRYLDPWLESRDHANQWDVSVLMPEAQATARDDEAE